MELSSKTKIAELLAKYSFLKEFLITMDEHFKTLDSPLMMKTVGRFADLGKVSMLTGVDPEKLLSSIAAEIGKRTGETVTVLKQDSGAADGSPTKVDMMKEIIRDLHKGVEMDILVKRFGELIRDVEPSQIAQMEQQLIAEGMPEAEIKRLCDVHVEVFRTALDKKVMPGLPAGHPVHTLMLENRALEDLIRDLACFAEPSADLTGLTTLLDKILQVNLHFLKKENQLFPVLETKGISGPSKVMWALHDDIRAILKDVRTRAEKDPVTPLEVKTVVTMLSDMIYKEEHILFPMALETLSEEDWTKVKAGEEEIGYAWMEPSRDWQPSGSTTTPELMAARAGSLNLDTGQLTVEQVNLLLTHLPVDISFVNEQDEVVYYSQTPDRIFPRSPGIIGRKVQNCHPPKSMDVVEKILNSFKSGEKDEASFWIEMRGRFIHIRYFAVRDSAGTYKGTLEVSQDLTDLRALQGQKRLLDW
ncbi:MAG: DUF438 domain-containing protein [Nitrospirae bacterium]|nr:MAG: DUF438 domain-containing protein [Nitrospirota bacterium]